MKSDQAWSNVLLIGRTLLALLQKIWIPLGWILFGLARSIYVATAPLRWLALSFYHVFAAPINFMSRFETLFYYFGTACIIGLLAGIGLFYTTRTIFGFLHLSGESIFDSKATRGRTAASYRAERAQKQAEQALGFLRLKELPLPSDTELVSDGKGWSPGGGLARYPLSPAADKKGLLSTTIFEEEDSSDYTTI